MSRYSRQARNEQIWAPRFQAYLKSEYRRAAREYPEPFNPNVERLEALMTTLHTRIILFEAEQTYVEFIMPFDSEDRRKDMIDFLAGAFRGGGLINFWQNLVGEYLQARIAHKISSITDTTRKMVMRIIEQGLNDGEGPEVIARRLRAEGDLQLNRSRMIARTETMSAMNQGALLAAESSEFQMEKRWDATLDQRTRLTHRDAYIHGDWIDLDQMFYLQNNLGVLEEAIAPGDANLSPENSINCRCGLDIRVKRDANGQIIRK